MLNIKQVLTEVYNDLINNPESVILVDDQHFIDKISGVEFHLYEDYLQVSRGEDKPVSVSKFTADEQKILMKMKDAITDPAITEDKELNHAKYVTEARQRFSDWFEKPVPVTDGIVEETDTTDYVRR